MIKILIDIINIIFILIDIINIIFIYYTYIERESYIDM